MIKKTIAYTDFNGNPQKTVAYFNFNKLEVLKLAAKHGMDIEEYAKKVAETGDIAKMLGFLEEIILGAYGKKSADGKSFVKSAEDRQAFENSNEYAELFDQLLSNPEETKRFAQGIVGTKPNKNNVSKMKK